MLVTRKVDGIVKELVVCLVFRTDVHRHRALRHDGSLVQHQYASHRVAAIHQRGGAFQYLYRVYGLRVHLNAVLVAPLLSFLSDAVVHRHNAVVAQSADDGF